MTYNFNVDPILQLVDGRNPLELAQFIDDHAAEALTDYEADFIEKLLAERLVQISPRQFMLLVKIYDERI